MARENPPLLCLLDMTCSSVEEPPPFVLLDEHLYRADILYMDILYE